MPTTDWTVGVADVGALLRARTVDGLGREVGTFNNDTRPNQTQVAAILASSVSGLAARVGVDIPQPLWGAASRYVALDAAMMVELTYFPESVNQRSSPYERLKELRDELLVSLVDAVGEQDTTGDADGSLSPSYGFPADAGGMVGWATKW